LTTKPKKREPDRAEKREEDKPKKFLTERKVMKAKRKAAQLPPVFMPNDPYAYNPRKRDLTGADDDTVESKSTKQQEEDAHEEALFDENMPVTFLQDDQDDDIDPDILKKMSEVYLG
jgi:hypothetical protein